MLREVAKVTRVYIYDASNKCNEVGLHSDDHGVRFYAYLMPKMTPTRANSCALGGSHETDYYTLNMLKPDVRDGPFHRNQSTRFRWGSDQRLMGSSLRL